MTEETKQAALKFIGESKEGVFAAILVKKFGRRRGGFSIVELERDNLVKFDGARWRLVNVRREESEPLKSIVQGTLQSIGFDDEVDE